MQASNKATAFYFITLRAEIKGENNERIFKKKITPQFEVGPTGKKN